MNKNSEIYEYVNFDKFKNLLSQKKYLNSESKFIFSVVSTMIFIEKFYEKKFRIIKKDIYLKDIEQFEEIILVGSGKGVVSVNFIEGYNWKRKSKETFNKIFKTFESEFSKNIYKYN